MMMMMMMNTHTYTQKLNLKIMCNNELHPGIIRVWSSKIEDILLPFKAKWLLQVIITVSHVSLTVVQVM